MNRNESYTVFNWMITELGLQGAELSTYAYVYGYSQAPRCFYTGTVGQIAELTGYCYSAVFRALTRLCEKEILIKSIEKDTTGALKTAYRANLEKVR